MCLVPNGYIVTFDQTNKHVRLLNMQLDELDQTNKHVRLLNMQLDELDQTNTHVRLLNMQLDELDQTNTHVRLLNMQLDELDQCNVYGSNSSIHCVSERQVVLSTRNKAGFDVIFQFLYVSQHHITLSRRVQLDDALKVYDWVNCMTLFCDKLYIGSSTGIHIFSLDLDLVRSVFKGGNVAHGAINWDRMYVAGTYANSPITLDSDGHIVNTLKEPGLGIIQDIVVADIKTVFVCGSESIIQVDRDGGRTIAPNNQMNDVYIQRKTMFTGSGCRVTSYVAR